MKFPEERPENFCLLPFKSIRQNAFGQNSPCAFGAGEWQHGHLNPKERWQSTELNQLRQDFIDGKKPEACNRCWAEEKAGKKSLRQRTLTDCPNDYEEFIKSDAWLKGPKVAVFKTSNICNLACRSCAGWDSSMYHQEGQFYVDTFGTTSLHQGKYFKHNRFVASAPRKHTDFTQFFEIAENLERIDFFGGEPFLNQTHLDLLEYLIEKNLSDNMTLFYSTNGTNHPSERLKRAWDKFKMIEISFSIDGVEKTFEYTRWPGKWATLLNVIEDVKNLKNILNCNMYLMSSLTISSVNCFEADKVLSWHKQNIGENHYINMVQSPDYLAIHTLPEQVKSVVRNHVKNPEVLGYLDINPSNTLKFRQFIIWMKRQDIYRKQNFADFYPEYHSLFAKEWESVTDLTDKYFYTLQENL
ncbi:twitch domain-containing radical SAM protein [bacterium]|nr:twitch domain-containing radical SAM protein [bacterium]